MLTLLGCECHAAVGVAHQADVVARLLQHPAVQLHLGVPLRVLTQHHHGSDRPGPQDLLLERGRGRGPGVGAGGRGGGGVGV